MKRDIFKYLKEWKLDPGRKPLIVRGARQVGKTYIIRELGKFFDSFVEINFELEPQLKKIFQYDLKPERICRDLTIATKKDIASGDTLLFFDEIQECPEAIKSLRFFYEKMPGLHVIAAGSFLEFVLDKTGVPVGRVHFIYVYPMSYLEFLTATGNQGLREEIQNFNSEGGFSKVVHENALRMLDEYFAVGGMPEAVETWKNTQNLKMCMNIHSELIESFRIDFAKYARTKKQENVDIVFNAIPGLIGKKFVYSSVNPDMRSRELKPALELLSKAGLAHIITHTSANGYPLGAEQNPLKFKVIMLDIALTQSLLNLDYGEWILDSENFSSNIGGLTEAFAGQELLAYSNAANRQSLFYWVKEGTGKAEVDYVISSNGKVIPVEVKSGHTGSLKSLKIFLDKKTKSPYGIHLSRRNYSEVKNVKQVPLYAICKLL
ncbi:MAG: ATP-binding protein [Oligoflexia bacterium]|nr:ATP-binding protein [Oligoflexia bacterium]